MAALNEQNVGLYKALLNEAGCSGLLEDSFYVHAFRSPRGGDLGKLEYRIRERCGAEMERINGDALRELEPAVSREFRGAVLIKGQARARSPGLILAALRSLYQRLGGRVHQGRVHSLTPDDHHRWNVVTDQGTLFSDTIVLALGAWSAKLLDGLNIHVPLEAERGYHVVFPQDSVTLRHSVMDVERKLVASSHDRGRPRRRYCRVCRAGCPANSSKDWETDNSGKAHATRARSHAAKPGWVTDRRFPTVCL